MTALPATDCTFLGWYGTNDDLFAASATLSIASLTSNLVLVAKFDSPDVATTFELGAAGTFTANGLATITLTNAYGSFFPSIPAYTASLAWHVYDWSPAMPVFTPRTNGIYTAQYVMLIANSRFLDNDLYSTSDRSPHAACLAVNNINNLLVRDSYFSGNRVCVAAYSDNLYWGSVAGIAGGNTTFLNCTMEDNVATNISTKIAYVGTFVTSANLALVNCVVDGSLISGDHTGEFVFTSTSSSTTLALINSAARNLTPGYVSFTYTSTATTLSLAHSAVSGIDTNLLATGSNGYLYNVSSADALLAARTLEGPNGAVAHGLSSASSFIRAGRPVWLAPDGYVYFYDDVADPATPWRRAVQKTSYAASVPDVGIDSAIIPDAFSQARLPGRIAYEPLNAPAGGTMLLLRDA